jgi:hypothetical protein
VEVVSTGTGSAYVLNVPAVFPLRNGVQVTFKANVVSAAAPTINVTGTGPILIKKEGGTTNLAAGDIKAGQVVHLAYDGSFWQMLSNLGNAVPAGSVTGSGTQNFVAKFNNAGGTSIGNSLIFDDGTNVSIGTTTAASLFHVYGSSPEITLQSSAGNFKTGYKVKTALNEWFFGQEGTAASGFRITDVDAGEVRLQIEQGGSGNVGIGTTTPVTKLHVAGNNPTSIINQVAENSTSSIQSGISMLRSRGTIAAPTAVLNGDFLGGYGIMGYDGTTFAPNGPNAGMYANAVENFSPGSNPSELFFQTTSSGSNIAQNRMIIKSNGNVGIGTNSPGTTLHVAGTNPSSIVNQVAENTSSNIQSGILMQRSRGTITSPSAVLSGDNLGGFYVIGYDGTPFGTNGPTAGLFVSAAENFTSTANGSDLHFETTALGDNSSTERMIIKANGDVGIGTSVPNQKLEIQDGHILLSNTGTQSELRFKEAISNGGQIVSFKAPAALSANVNYTLPVDDGSASQVLATDGTGILSWQSVSGTLNGGTLNYHPKWTSANSLSSTSLIYDDGTNLGVGMNNPGVIPGSSSYVSMASSNAYSSSPMSLELIGTNTSNVAPVTKLDFIHVTNGPTYDAIGSIQTFRNSSNTRGSMAFFTADGSGIIERMRLKSNGYLGIGTNNPQELLQIESTGSTAVSLMAGAGGTARYYMGSSTLTYAGAMEYDISNNSMNFWTNNTPNRLFISGGGNVGIATSTPSSAFSVGAGATSPFQVNTSGNIMRINNVATSFPAAQGGANTYLQNNGAGILTWAAITGTLSGGSVNQVPKWTSGTTLGNSQISDNGTSVNIATNTTINYTGVATAALAVNSPSLSSLGAALSVANSSSISAINSNLSSIGFGDGFSSYTAFIKAVRDAAGAANDYPTALTFFTTSDNTNVSGERMRLDNAGNLGVGLTAPAAKLHSSGQIRSGIPTGGMGGATATTGSILFYNSATANTATIQSGNTTSTFTLTLPPSAPSVANSALVGALTGVLSWAPPGTAGAGLPSGTSGQTLRHDGANWIANGFLFNNGTSIGIGTTTPVEILELSSIDSDIEVETYSTVESSSLHIKRARGTAATPTVPLSGDYYGGVGFQGYDGTAFQEAARIQGAVDGSAAANDMPGRLEFWTASDGTASAVERMRLTNAGNLGIGTNAPGASRLNVVIPNTDAVNPIGLTVTNNYTGASIKYGIDVNVDGAGSGTKYGISSSVVGLAGDASSIYGYQVAMTPSGTGSSFGVYSSASAVGTGLRYGFYNNISALSTNTSAIYGFYNILSKPAGSSGDIFGIYSSTNNSGTGTSYGMYSNNSGTAPIRYGIYTTGETDNYISSNLGIGVTTPAFALDVKASSTSFVAEFENQNTGTSTDGLKVSLNPVTPLTGAYWLACYQNTGSTLAGGVRADGAGNVVFATTSDRRLKQNIIEFSNTLSIIEKLEPKQYEFKRVPGVNQFGFIAQDLQKVYPFAVVGSPDSDIETDPMMVDYSKLTPLLTGGIKELNEIVKLQDKRIKTLEQQLAELKLLIEQTKK